ncbi:cytochrome c oxidase subunit 3 family protein [Motiliproteus sp.]|uniref:cytochrome c oxidase subunit 3 family protein n=1 Tax=Motiliproteus sp. TaxID=1898955 RepID=UPI003BACFD6B
MDMSVDQTVESTTDNSPLPVRRVPGDMAMWCFILAELTAFALMFILFSWLRSTDRELFLAGQQLLHPEAGLINTLALLSASGFVAQGVIANRASKQLQASRWMLAGLAVAMIYVVVKCWEYYQLGSAGYGLNGNRFFTAYFLLTGFHFLHVLLGMSIIGYVTRRLRQQVYGPDNRVGLESVACYWHMVDLLWIVLFPLVYVIR